MRDLEFLPDWYPTLRRKKRIVMLEGWLGIVVILGLGLWVTLSARNIETKEALLNTRQGQLRQTNYELQKLNELESLKRQMSDQAQLLNRLGPNVPIGRLIDVLAQMMPREMALIEMTIGFQEQARAPMLLVAANGSEPTINRDMNVELHGVAPSDVDVGNFMINLATIPHYAGTGMTTVDAHDQGHSMRDYKISFTVNLNDADH
jgi:Tfp pilus assembly protein PilN